MADNVCRADGNAAQVRKTWRHKNPTPRNCIVCGCEFSAIQDRTKYCSQNCRNKKARPDKITPRELSCLRCGAIFMSTWGRKFCCAACAKPNRPLKPERCCDQCGKAFRAYSKRSRFCSEPCRAVFFRVKAETKYSGVCLHCGDVFTSSSRRVKCCSWKCSGAYMGAARIKKNEQKRIPYYCRHCSKPFHPKAVDRTTYCSKKCFYSHQTANARGVAKKQSCPIWARECIVCASEFIARHKAKAICSDACRKQKDRADSIAAFKAKDTRDRSPRDCKECGTSFVPEYGNKRNSFCSGKCAKRHGGRIGKATRRARVRGSEYESVNPYEILHRDGWRCWICGCDTPRKLRGTIEPNAPEVDHVIPLGVGGSHTKGNMRCACRACNGAKGANIINGLGGTSDSLQLFPRRPIPPR